MPLFKCEHCGCRENTATGCFWSRCNPEIFDWVGIEDRQGKALCSACGPTKYRDGIKTAWGAWHGLFPRVPYTEQPT